MSDHSFAALWRDAYTRERPVIAEAQRLAAADPGLAADPYALFRAARSRVAAAEAFERGLARVDPEGAFRRRRRAMAELLAAAS